MPDPRSAAGPRGARAEAVVDLAAVRHNVEVLTAAAPGAALMAVVKADGYGHGAVPVARAAEIAADGAPVPSSAIQQAIPAAIRSVRASV